MSVSQLQMGRARERKEEARRKKETALESSFLFYSSVQAWMGKGDLGASQSRSPSFFRLLFGKLQDCQDVRRKRAVSGPDGLPGKTRVNATEPRPLCTPASISICCPEHTHIQTDTQETHTHTHRVRQSKINTVRATMIPLHYLHVGPPSCTCLPLSPLHLYGGSNY